MYTTPMSPATERARSSSRPVVANPWLLWRPEGPTEPERLTVAELAECRCPELCDRDHDNE